REPAAIRSLIKTSLKTLSLVDPSRILLRVTPVFHQLFFIGCQAADWNSCPALVRTQHPPIPGCRPLCTRVNSHTYAGTCRLGDRSYGHQCFGAGTRSLADIGRQRCGRRLCADPVRWNVLCSSWRGEDSPARDRVGMDRRSRRISEIRSWGAPSETGQQVELLQLPLFKQCKLSNLRGVPAT